MTDASKMPLGADEFATLARYFLESAPQPDEQAVAGFAERVYQLGYEHGHREGGSESLAAWLRLTTKGDQP